MRNKLFNQKAKPRPAHARVSQKRSTGDRWLVFERRDSLHMSNMQKRNRKRIFKNSNMTITQGFTTPQHAHLGRNALLPAADRYLQAKLNKPASHTPVQWNAAKFKNIVLPLPLLLHLGLPLACHRRAIRSLQPPHICEHTVIVPATNGHTQNTQTGRNFHGLKKTRSTHIANRSGASRRPGAGCPFNTEMPLRCTCTARVRTGKKQAQKQASHLWWRLGIETIVYAAAHCLSRI